MNRQNTQPSFIRFIKKFFLSIFVVVSFIGYALHNRSAFADSAAGDPGSNPPTPQTDQQAVGQQPAPSATPSGLAFNDPAPTLIPTNTPQAAVPNTSGQSAQNGQYKDGTYTGPEIDINFGLIQVQAQIQNGKISGVQVLEYPTDRRTSRRINSFAVPRLQQEAVQAQSANVFLITGATLTSEGFQESLQVALNQARNVQ